MTSTSASLRASFALLLLSTALPGAIGCRAEPADSGDGGAADGGSSDGGSGDGGASGTVQLADANNYSFHGELDGPSFSLAEYQDVSISWAGLTEDLQCHDLDPVADIDNVALMIFPLLTQAEVESGLANDSLEQVDLGAYLSFEPGDQTSVSLTELTFFGTDADIENEFYEGHGAWLLVLTSGTTVGVGSRMIAFLEPTQGETATSGQLTDGCSVLDAEADLQSLVPTPIATDGPWLVDWSALTKTMQGNDFEPLEVTEIMVARYDQSPAQLEDIFLDLELITDDFWLAPHLAGATNDLSGLQRASDGSAFPGFDAEGTWLFALRCGTCANPAPVFLTVLEPTP